MRKSTSTTEPLTFAYHGEGLEVRFAVFGDRCFTPGEPVELNECEAEVAATIEALTPVSASAKALRDAWLADQPDEIKARFGVKVEAPVAEASDATAEGDAPA